MNDDTIAAIATPLGEGAIGVVKISGPEAVKVAERVLKSGNITAGRWESHRMCYGYVCEAGAGEIIDEVLYCFMGAPRSYTMEDVVEINCHGGLVPLRKTLELVLASGARLAEPGEFTKRAFLNGRLDLAQAESVIDLIRTKTEKNLKMALAQLKGDLSGRINTIQDRLLSLLAKIEVEIDYPDDEHNDQPEGKKTSLESDILDLVEILTLETEDLLRGADAGIICREGIKAAIIGRPNVGKSSLLNALLRQNRAIVTEAPGTTRDVIEETANIKGIPVCLLDTAGMRETTDLVESIGVQRAKEAGGQADLVLAVFDGAAAFSDEDRAIIEIIGEKKHILIINKEDKGISEQFICELDEVKDPAPVVRLSALSGQGIGVLEEMIAETVLQGDIAVGEPLVTNIRHKAALEKAADYLKEARGGLIAGIPVDIVAIDLKEAWETLGEITGAVVTEDILERIFKDFCVGK